MELLKAAASGDIATVQRIVSSKTILNLSYQNEVGMGVSFIENFRSHSDRTSNFTIQDGISALHFAAMNGHYAVAKALLTTNINKELKDRDVSLHIFCWPLLYFKSLYLSTNVGMLFRQAGETALHKSARNGHTNVLELLLQKGANREATNKVWLLHLFSNCFFAVA